MNGSTFKKIQEACKLFWPALKVSRLNPYRNRHRFIVEMVKKWKRMPRNKIKVRDLFTHLTGYKKGQGTGDEGQVEDENTKDISKNNKS